MNKKPIFKLSEFLTLGPAEARRSYEVLIFDDEASTAPSSAFVTNYEALDFMFHGSEIKNRKDFWGRWFVINLLTKEPKYSSPTKWEKNPTILTNRNAGFFIDAKGNIDFNNSRANDLAAWVYSVKLAYMQFPQNLVSLETIQKCGMSSD